ncbi:Restriction endonuclease, type I, EcoRI, R subunit/Type III [Emticicia oligotrophica DSM 17448]|uniref:Restriction endonuclease, type I, EcoRI, R subunit/Type III n=1 Tax=Emticicia oligotrophica (strain DSM 17448 / CIP 109782 / MTCC 6937 / GPTSA100-15) TaxID=929562 RepID=A0ABN4APY5_EMTOG|nr:type I restriction enzyme HsdR N-terminal domain-containing protein [Emticicia oligotrophica]AFK04448.1 Restriction endonuclease, type I, EcoRI, R subunit/Type III [Emticicia oligotrophica DSM 17448]
MQQLNLPTFAYKIKESEGKTYIYDAIRKKYLVLTPEEWVRQHFINLLLTHYGYSKSLLRLEGGLTYNKLQKRSDIVVFENTGQPYLLVECKAADVPINQAVVAQASRYNLTLRCPYLAVTNGMSTFCFKVDFENGKFEQLKDLPKAAFEG